jgi:putative transposase
MCAASTAYAGWHEGCESRHVASLRCQPTYYNWKSRYGGLGVSELKRIRELEAEHARLKRMYADLAMENHALKELLEKKL